MVLGGFAAPEPRQLVIIEELWILLFTKILKELLAGALKLKITQFEVDSDPKYTIKSPLMKLKLH